MNQMIIRMLVAILIICGTTNASAQELQRNQQSQRNLTKNNVQAPDFTLNDINGKPFTLSKQRGKYLVLDFWGSWCIWCIRGIPDMKKYYEKYKDKMEIIGMDCRDTEEKWKAAVMKYELPWKHVYVPKESNVLENYKIKGFPTKIVLAPDGKVLKTIVGEAPEFYDYLDELLGN
jgi:thiol-disulfide isomerase/thioredoxin